MPTGKARNSIQGLWSILLTAYGLEIETYKNLKTGYTWHETDEEVQHQQEIFKTTTILECSIHYYEVKDQ